MILKDYENFSGLKSVHAMCGGRMEDYEKNKFQAHTQERKCAMCNEEFLCATTRNENKNFVCNMCFFFVSCRELL